MKAAALVLGLLLGQDDLAEQLEKLRSDKVEDREAATKRLREIGKPAVEALKKAATDEDKEYAFRAKRLLELITADLNPLLHPDRAKKRAPEVFKVKVSTSRGDFVVQVTREWAPLGADRFYNLVDAGFYDECRFFRVVAGFMAQFGINGDPAVSEKWRAAKLEDDPVKEKNTRGRITFATSGKDSRTTQLFINFGDNRRLDGMGFAPFGEVIEGMEIVDKLHSGYGEGAPRGKGPSQQQIQTEGNGYLKDGFPQLDFIKSAKIVD
jgi:peptidyl-prolyl cis-trans isomerase A (cyclophilin A)